MPNCGGSPLALSPTLRTLFIFLPERLDELAQVQGVYPRGRLEERPFNGPALFAVYDPLVDERGIDWRGRLASLRSVIAQAADAMPTHAEYVRSHCRAPGTP